MHPLPMRQQHRQPYASRGVSLLLAIIILGAGLLVVATSALIVGLTQQESGYAVSRGGEARSLADGCMNEDLLRIDRDASWGLDGGAMPFTAPNGSCTMQVSDLGGGNRQIDIRATVAEYTAHIRATVSIAGVAPVILSWEERSD